MRREYFSLEISNVAWVDESDEPEKPMITISFDGERSDLERYLTKADGDPYEAGDVDVAFRLQGSLDDPDAAGVVAITSRLTGDYICELNVEAADVTTFITAARRYGEQTGDTGRYFARIEIDGEEVITFDKRTLLVYSSDGELLRQQSLIPSGVEI